MLEAATRARAAGHATHRLTAPAGAPATIEVAPPRTGVAHYVAAGLAVVALMIAGIGHWAASTEIAGAVIAPATVVVDSSVKKVQHPSGGIVGGIRARNGDRVAAGELLIHLDDTQTRANLQIIINQIDEIASRRARLAAEQTDAAEITFPDSLARRGDDPPVRQILDGQDLLFDSRRASLLSQQGQLRERIVQLEKEIEGLAAQRDAKAKEIKLIGNELASLSDLEQQKLVTASKMIALRREAARLDGEHAQIDAAIAQAKGRIAEVEIAILQRLQEFKKEVAGDMRDAEARLAELNERRVAAEDQLKRVDIVAPVSGYVHQLAVHTIGGVVAPGEPIMLIVPDNDLLTIDARVAPRDREQVVAGTQAKIRFAAFNQRTTPELSGVVKMVAADLSEDQRTGQPYYSVRIAIGEQELSKLAGLKIVPGLPAEVQIRTQDRTALSYFLKPIEDQFARAFRER